jgi:hypothetical protein
LARRQDSKHDTKTEQATEQRWAQLNETLKSAADTWQVLSEESKAKCAPDEEQLVEFKRLLKELQNQIEDLK